MNLNTTTLTALSALSGRIIDPVGTHPYSARMAAIFNDLSPVELTAADEQAWNGSPQWF